MFAKFCQVIFQAQNKIWKFTNFDIVSILINTVLIKVAYWIIFLKTNNTLMKKKLKINRPNDLKICSGTWMNCSIRMINCSNKLKIWCDKLVNRLNDFVNGSNEIKIRSYEIRNLSDESINGSDALRETERQRDTETQRDFQM